jgi:hypothetical protein
MMTRVYTSSTTSLTAALLPTETPPFTTNSDLLQLLVTGIVVNTFKHQLDLETKYFVMSGQLATFRYVEDERGMRYHLTRRRGESYTCQM